MARALQTTRLLHLPQPIMAFSLACRLMPSQSDASRLASDANIQPFKSGRNHPPALLAAQTRRSVTATNIKNTRSLFVMMEREAFAIVLVRCFCGSSLVYLAHTSLLIIAYRRTNHTHQRQAKHGSISSSWSCCSSDQLLVGIPQRVALCTRDAGQKC